MSYSLQSIEMENMYWYLLLAAASIWIWLHFFRKQHMHRLLDKLVGPPGYPLIGNLLDINVPDEEFTETVVTYVKKYARKGIMKVNLAGRWFVFVFSAQGSEVILNSKTQITKSKEYNYFHPWLRTGLLTSTGDKWRSRRKLLTSAFHFSLIDDFMGVYNENSEILVNILAENYGKSVLDIYPFVARCALDIICESAMGCKVNAQKNMDSPYVKAVDTMLWVLLTRNTTPHLWPDWLFSLTKVGKTQKRCLQIMHSFTKMVIKKRRQELKFNDNRPKLEKDAVIGKKVRLAFLDLLLEVSKDGQTLSDLDIQEEVDTIMFEGHDTISSGMISILFLLGTHPEIQEKVQREVDAVLGDTGRPVTLDDLSSMKYLECCVKESLRLFPPVPFVARQLTEDLEIDGQVIPAGVTLLLLLYMLHRDSNQWKDPEIFDPDRFLPENSVGRHPYLYVPFSAGPRNCIGQKFGFVKLKVILAHILRSYTVEAMEKVKPFELKVYIQIITRPQNGLKVKLHPRIKSAK